MSEEEPPCETRNCIRCGNKMVVNAGDTERICPWCRIKGGGVYE